MIFRRTWRTGMSERKRISLSCSVWFCLLFLAGGAPRLEALPLGLRSGGGVDLGYDALHGVCNVGYGYSEAVNVGRHVPDSFLFNDLIRRVGALHVESPLLNGELAGDVVNDLSFLRTPDGSRLNQGYNRGQDDPENDPSSGDQGGVNINGGENHDQFWWWAIALSPLIGCLIASFIFRQNVEDRHPTNE